MTDITDIILVFVGGGILCVIAQLLIDLTRLTPARILVLYVSLGVLLYGVGLFDPMKEIFGTGVTLPLIGFGANIAMGVREAVDKSGLCSAGRHRQIFRPNVQRQLLRRPFRSLSSTAAPCQQNEGHH